MQGDPGIADIEIFGQRPADRTFHKLLELYRVYLYQVSGRFNISVVNFSQESRIGTEIRRSVVIGPSPKRWKRSVADRPALVAVGDGPEFGVVLGR